MYQGDIPFAVGTDQPMYYPTHTYEWEYDGKRYESWYLIRDQFGEHAVNRSKKIDIPPDWRPNKPFRAVLTLDNYCRGRSAANFEFKDQHGNVYTIFLTDMLDLLKRTTLTEGKTEDLEWCFCKRGQNYGLQLYEGMDS